MRDAFYRYLPMVLGTILGWLLLWSPPWLDDLGPWGWVLHYGLALLVLLSFLSLTILTNLPREPKLTPVGSEEVSEELRARADELAALGLEEVTPPYRVNVSPSAIMIGFVHPSEPIYGAVYEPGSLPPRQHVTFVSILYGSGAGLTTSPSPAGAVLPAGHRSLRQVLPGASTEELLEAHRRGVDHVEARGLSWRPVTRETFPDDVARSLRIQREVFLKAPLRGTLITLWRVVSSRNPFLGLLAEQAVASKQLDRLSMGETGWGAG